MRHRQFGRVVLAVLALVPAVARSQTWQGGTSTDWTVGANWSSGSAPVTASAVVFSGSPTNLPSLGGTTRVIRSLTYDSTAGVDFNLGPTSASTLALTGIPLLTQSSATAQTMSSVLHMYSTSTLTGTRVNLAGGDLTLLGGFRWSGSGNASFTTNTFDVVGQGTLNIGPTSGASGAVFGGNLTTAGAIGSAATSIRLVGNTTTGQTINLNVAAANWSGISSLNESGVVLAGRVTVNVIDVAGPDQGRFSFARGSQAALILKGTTSATFSRPISTNSGVVTLGGDSPGNTITYGGQINLDSFSIVNFSASANTTTAFNNIASLIGGNISISGPGVVQLNLPATISTFLPTITVLPGATLAGSNPAAVLNIQGKLAPGLNGIGTMTTREGTVTFQPGSTFAATLTGSSSNQLVVENLNKIELSNTGVGAANRLTVSVASNGFTGTSYDLMNIAFVPANPNASRDIILNGIAIPDGTLLGEFIVGTGNVNDRDILLDIGAISGVNIGDMFTLTLVDHTLRLNFTPVPEPMTVLAVAAGGLGLVRLARRRLTVD